MRAQDIAAAVEALRSGEVVGLPTETVYGLAGDASNPAAIARIYAIKGRPARHPVIVHLADSTHLERWARDVPDAARALAAAFWPGPLTLVLPRQPWVLASVTGGQDTVALRVPAHPVALAVLRAFDGGLAAPSANRYGRVSPTTAAHVRDDLGSDVRLVLDGGPSEVGLESTIVACLHDQVTLLRPGRITSKALEAVIGTLSARSHEAPRVPGSVVSHYAPQTPVELVPAASIDERVARHTAAGRRVALLAPPGLRSTGTTAAIIAASEPHAYGRTLYANLRALDAAGADVLVIAVPPADAEWDAARDRLSRAAARQP